MEGGNAKDAAKSWLPSFSLLTPKGLCFIFITFLSISFPFVFFFLIFFFNWKRHVIYSTNKLHSSITKGLNAITFYKVQRLAKACPQSQMDFKLLFYSAKKWLISGRVKQKPEICLCLQVKPVPAELIKPALLFFLVYITGEPAPL